MKRDTLLKLYARLFARRRLYRFNRLLYDLSLRGMGVMNFEDDRLSGERAFVRSYLAEHPGALVIDVGANVGRYASLVMSLDPSAGVWALEPHPQTFAKLQAAAQRAGFRAFNVGCGARDEEAPLFDYRDGGASSHASLDPGTFSELRRAEASSQPVRLVRLDSFCREHGIERIGLLKIDAEGHELPILAGAGALPAEGRIGCIQLEFNEHQALSRTFLRDFRERLPKYELFRLLPDGPMPLESAYVPRYWEIFGFQNIVAVLRPGA